MASRYSSERSERESGIVGAARCSQPISVSEDCVEPGSEESECRETADNSVFLGLSERASMEENLRDVSERIPKSELVPLANHSVHGASSDLTGLIREINHINGVCLTFAHLSLQCGETVTVEKEIW